MAGRYLVSKKLEVGANGGSPDKFRSNSEGRMIPALFVVLSTQNMPRIQVNIGLTNDERYDNLDERRLYA
jgi:hypothetical protein